MRSEEAEKAISRIQYLIKVKKETMYNIALSDYYIEKIEILLNYIEELEKELEPIHKLNIPVETLVAEYERLEDLEDNISMKIEEYKQLVSKDGEKFEFKEIKKEL